MIYHDLIHVPLRDTMVVYHGATFPNRLFVQNETRFAEDGRFTWLKEIPDYEQGRPKKEWDYILQMFFKYNWYAARGVKPVCSVM